MSIYRSRIEPTLTDDDQGKWLIINTESGDCELFASEAAGLERLMKYERAAPVYLMPIGEEPLIYLRRLPLNSKP